MKKPVPSQMSSADDADQAGADAGAFHVGRLKAATTTA